MINNKLKKIILLVSILGCSNTWSATTNYLGIDYKNRSMNGHGTDTYTVRDVLPSSYNGAQIYYARRYDSNVGFDVGYEQSQNKSQTHYFANNDTFLGVPQSNGDYTVFNNRIRAVQFDIVGYVNFLFKIEAIGQLGFSIMQADMTATGTVNGITTNLAPSKTYNFIPRIGLGVQYFGNSNIGFRALVNWEETNNYRLNITDEDGVRRTIAPFSQSWCFMLGIIAKF